MNLNFSSHFDSLQGNWTTKKSIFLIKSKIERRYEEKFNLKKTNNLKQKLDYELKYNLIQQKNNIFTHELYFSNNLITKRYNNLEQLYDINIVDKTLIKVNFKLKSSNIIYHEYIYFINKNLSISVSLLKKNSKYLMIIFTSYIKKIT